MAPADWYPGSIASGSPEFTHDYLEAYGGTAQGVDDSSAEAYAVGQVVADIADKTNKIDNATIINTLHSGTWSTILGDLSWSDNGAPRGQFTLVQWQHGNLLPVFPLANSATRPEAPKPNWGSG